MRLITYIAMFMSALTLLQFRMSQGFLVTLMAFPKALVAALTPLWTLLGAIGALAACWRRDRLAAMAGLFAAVVSIRHIIRVTQSKDDLFTQAFGLNWQQKIPSSIKAHMLSRRWPSAIPESQAGFRCQRDVTFGSWPDSGEPLLCDLWQPPSQVAPSGLAIIYLHGSAWHFADKDFLTGAFFRHLAGQGHLIMDVAYTLAPKAELTGMVGDVKRAISWMKRNASAYGARPDRIILMGGSAGGHLSLLSAYTPNHPALQPPGLEDDTSVRAVVSYYGFSDMVATYEYLKPDFGEAGGAVNKAINQRLEEMAPAMRRIGFVPEYGGWTGIDDWIPSLMGGTPEELPEKYKLGSPLSHVGPDNPPTLLLQGAHDMGGMVGQIRELHQALRQAGALSVYIELPDTEHGFDLILPQISPAAQTATYYTERFLGLMV